MVLFFVVVVCECCCLRCGLMLIDVGVVVCVHIGVDVVVSACVVVAACLLLLLPAMFASVVVDVVDWGCCWC